MNLRSLRFLRAAAVALALPILGVSATVNVNGGLLTYNPGTSTSGSFSEAIFVGADEYFLSATYSYGATAAGDTTITFLPTVQYIGGAPTATADTIHFNLLASIYDSGAVNWNGTYGETIPLVIPTGGTGSGELFADGDGIGLLGPYGAGSYDPSASANLTSVIGSTLNYSYDLTFTFAAGSPDLTTASSPAMITPEPATIIPAALGLVGLGLMTRRRRKQ